LIVLDSHAWVWWVSSPDQLSPPARRAIENAIEARAVHVSCISTWEVALLVANGRLTLTMDVTDWIAHCQGLPFLRFVPVDNAIALGSIRLPEPLHRDPADRLIVATARSLGVPLVTKDTRLRRYLHVETIW
jgi:PIN domain nuclease of toxin-antitoxin system